MRCLRLKQFKKYVDKKKKNLTIRILALCQVFNPFCSEIQITCLFWMGSWHWVQVLSTTDFLRMKGADL